MSKIVESNAGSLTSFYGISKNFIKMIMVNAVVYSKASKAKIMDIYENIKGEEQQSISKKAFYTILICAVILASRLLK